MSNYSYISTTESLMRNSVELGGWKKIDNVRAIRLGNISNCNEDGLIKNHTIKQNMNEILNKYDIIDYNLHEISNEFEHSYELQLREEIYTELKKKLMSK